MIIEIRIIVGGEEEGGRTAKACKTISQVVEMIYIFIGMLVSLVDTLSKLSKCIVKICALYTLTNKNLASSNTLIYVKYK